MGTIIKNSAFEFSPEAVKKAEKARESAINRVITDDEVNRFISEKALSNDVIDTNISELNNHIIRRSNPITQGYSPALRDYEGMVITEYAKTDNQKLKEHEYTTTAVLDRNSIIADKAMLKATFSNFNHSTPKETEVLKKACDIARRYLEGEEFNTIFKGGVGAGKSHLAMAIAQWVNEKSRQKGQNKRILFLDVNEMFRKVKASFNNIHTYWTEDNIMTLIRSSDLLILDDLGSESSFSGKQASEYVQQFLFAIVNAHHSIITTTNLEDPSTVYNPKIVSRLKRNSKESMINFNGITDKR
uniref:ATP-binding protein n=1 Tax=Lactococcus garvieae TaxID=1363 RepID=UPI00359C2F54